MKASRHPTSQQQHNDLATLTAKVRVGEVNHDDNGVVCPVGDVPDKAGVQVAPMSLAFAVARDAVGEGVVQALERLHPEAFGAVALTAGTDAELAWRWGEARAGWAG